MILFIFLSSVHFLWVVCLHFLTFTNCTKIIHCLIIYWSITLKILYTNRLCQWFLRYILINFSILMFWHSTFCQDRLNYEIIIVNLRGLFHMLMHISKLILLLMFNNFLHFFTWYHLRCFKVYSCFLTFHELKFINSWSWN